MTPNFVEVGDKIGDKIGIEVGPKLAYCETPYSESELSLRSLNRPQLDLNRHVQHRDS